MVGYGIPELEICAVLGISKPTLERRLRVELDTGVAQANATVAESMYQMATKGPYSVRFSAAKYWLACRAGWKEPVVHEIVRTLDQMDSEEIAYRIQLDDNERSTGCRRAAIRLSISPVLDQGGGDDTGRDARPLALTAVGGMAAAQSAMHGRARGGQGARRPRDIPETAGDMAHVLHPTGSRTAAGCVTRCYSRVCLSCGPKVLRDQMRGQRIANAPLLTFAKERQ
jgi:hypothetical protein